MSSFFKNLFVTVLSERDKASKDTDDPYQEQLLSLPYSIMVKPVMAFFNDFYHGVQRRMISVVNFFVFLRLLFFTLLLLYVT